MNNVALAGNEYFIGEFGDKYAYPQSQDHKKSFYRCHFIACFQKKFHRAFCIPMIDAAFHNYKMKNIYVDNYKHLQYYYNYANKLPHILPYAINAQ
jgi:hypothetical protein